MKVYKVKVNGKVYEVELEAVEEKKGNIETATVETKHETNVTGGKTIEAPIAGKVLDIKVKVGDVIKQNQTVAVIEAMKLENEIQSPFAGKVVDILVGVGASVKNKDALIIVE